ncbi:MAG: NosD domain-containing protein, partial [Candidatus Hodarchaeota archaeon]
IVEPVPLLGNTFFENGFFENYNGFQSWLASDNIIEGNYLDNNNGEGIGIYGSSNNTILSNYIGYSGRKGIMVSRDFGFDFSSDFNTIAWNIVYGSAEDGISLEWADNNLVVGNDIFENAWAGIHLFGTSSYNTLEDNTIHNNWGCGIVFESYSEVHMRFWQDITATEADYIWWHISFLYEDEGQAWYEHDNMDVQLTIDGEPVGVWYSDVYWDDGWQQYRFDVDYYSEPLPEGVHEFTVQCILEDGILLDYTAYVIVIPAPDEHYISHNAIISNDISENNWCGIDLGRARSNYVACNHIHYQFGDGIHLSGLNNVIVSNTICYNEGADINLNEANSNFIAFNEIFENSWNGIQLSGTSSENTVIGNSIHNNWWGTGIQLETWSEVHLRFGQDISATEADYISWIETFRDPDEETVQFWYENLEVLLNVDGEPVGVWFSEMYFDGEQWAFEMSYFSDPLPVGVHEFYTEIYYKDEFYTNTAIVTIIPYYGTSWNIVSNNLIYDNWDNGITLVNSDKDMIFSNELFNYYIDILLINSKKNIISRNIIYSTSVAGIVLVGDSQENSVSNNIISGCFYNIYLGFSPFNMIFFNSIDNSQYGIFLYNSNENLLFWNTVSNNYEGIYLFESHGNRIFRNIVSNNHIGIHLISSVDNILSSNMFFGNDEDIIEEP